MKSRVLLTGATGVLGEALLSAVRDEEVTLLVRGSKPLIASFNTIPAGLETLSELDHDWDIIIHAAANTKFTSAKQELWRSNVELTQHLIQFARSCPRLKRFIHVSTTCVAGHTKGFIPEEFCTSRPGFQNLYEESKWEAEALFPNSGLPFQVLRIPIVIGDRARGGIRRPLAIHRTLRWIALGLIPVLPSVSEVRLDIISADYVTDILQEMLRTVDPHPMVHACRGARAPRLSEILDFLVIWLRAHWKIWKEEVFNPPLLLEPAAFSGFRHLIEETDNPVFRSIYQVTDVLESTLTVPKCFATSVADRVLDTAWEPLCERVFEFHLSTEPSKHYVSGPTI